MTTKHTPARCGVSGNEAADGWKHRKGWRCTDDAAFISTGGTRFCQACREHGLRLSDAEIKLAKRRALAIKTATKLPQKAKP